MSRYAPRRLWREMFLAANRFFEFVRELPLALRRREADLDLPREIFVLH
jgi:hypothetical protein